MYLFQQVKNNRDKNINERNIYNISVNSAVSESMSKSHKPHTKFQCDCFLSVKMNHVGAAMLNPHPLSHPHVVNNAHSSTWRPYAKFQPES